jgi:regulator of replication initiation timing
MSRVATAASVRPLDLDPIDRLEEKVKMLVAMIGRLKAEQVRAAEENVRLSRELDAARAQIADAQSGLTEVAALRSERETIRGRVSDMLHQLEGLNL